MGTYFQSRCDCGALTVTNFWDWRYRKRHPRCGRCGATLQEKGKSYRPKRQDGPKPERKVKAETRTDELAPELQAELETLNHLSGTMKEVGLNFSFSTISTKGRPTLHVKFNHNGQRVIDWWPSTGTVLIGGPTGIKSRAENAGEAYALAVKAKRYRELTGKIFPGA